MDFECTLFSDGEEYTVSFRTLEPDMLMIGCKWKSAAGGVQIHDAEGEHLGNLKPSYPSVEKTDALYKWFLEEHRDKRIL